MRNIYILIAVLALAAVAILMFLVKGAGFKSRLSPLAGVAFAFVLAGIFFGESRLVGYGLMGAGVLLAVIDMVRKLKKR